MSSIPNYKLKKNNTLGIKPKKKSIPININTNPTPGKFLFSNQVNNIASSYLSMGQRIQINKNLKDSKIIHVNTNSATNYYTLNSKDAKQTNCSITNSILNNLKINNKSELNSINVNNYMNLNNNNYSLQYEINRIHINSKDKKQLSTLSNSKISNDLLINGYQNSKNNLNNSKFKNKINNATNSINHFSKNKQTYSTRPNFLDSKIKTKKVPMKSKIRQYKCQYKNNKSISTSFNNVYSTKRHFQGNYQRDFYNYVRGNILNNIKNEKNYENIFGKNNTHYNLIDKNNNLYEIKNRHNRHNTASFCNKEIMNILHKKNLSNKINNNINNININEINEKSKNRIKNSININNKNNNIETNSAIHNNIINKINISNNSRKKIKKLSNGKISDIKVLVNEKRLNIKENKYNSNNNSNIANNHNFYYTKYLSNNYHSSNNSNIVNHHIKNPTANININITGIKKISVKQKDPKKVNKTKITSKPIPTPAQKIKSNLIPSQRNIKINLTKFLQGVKTKQNNKNKIIMGRKSFSIKKLSKENNSDFSLPQFNDKLSNKLLKSNEEEKNVNDFNYNKNIKIKNIEEYGEISEIPKKNIRNLNLNLGVENKIEKNKDGLINIICRNNNHKNNNKNYLEQNCNSNNSTSNNIYYGNNKNEYSIDNITEPISNKINGQRKKSNENNLQNINDLNNSNLNINKNNDIEQKQDENIIKDNTTEKKDSNKKDNYKEDINNKLIDNNIKNNLFDEENLDELPEDYDENFNDLYSIINKINFGSVLVCVEGLFTPEGRTYKKYKDKFDKFYDKLYMKKGNSFSNSNNKPKKIIEVAGLTSNTKTNSSSSKKNIVSPHEKYNDLNIVKELNVNC